MSASLLTVPEFHALTDDAFAAMESTLVATVLDAAGVAVGESWLEIRSQGHLFRTAHMLTLIGSVSGSGGPAGPLTSRSIDGISASYAAPVYDASDGGLGSTSWGRMFLELRRAVLTVPTVDFVLA